MSAISIGDLAQSFYLRRHNLELKTELSRLTSELSSGKVNDVTAHLNGELTYLVDIEHSLKLNDVFSTSAKEAASFSATMQTSLGHVQDQLSALSNDVLTYGTNSVGYTPPHFGDAARLALGAIVSSLNVTNAGRAIFAGDATDQTPLQSAQAMLTDLRGALVGQSSLAGVEAAMDVWFGAGGGFETSAYAGGADNLSAFQLGDGERVDLKIKADDPVLRDALKAVAMTALSQDTAMGFSEDLRDAMLARSGELGLAASDALTTTRAALGHAEARIEEAGVRLSAQRTSLEIAQNELSSADPYDTVMRLEETQFRLESLYTITARLSELSLVGFLR